MIGVILREKGVYEEAERFFLEALSKDHAHSDAYDALGILYGIRGQIDQALKAHKKATDLKPKIAKYWHNYGFALCLAQKFKEAIKAFQRSLSLAPEQERTFVSLAFAFGALGDYQEMRRYLSQVLTTAQVEFNLGVVREKRGEREVALAHYRRALSLHQNFELARESIGRLERELTPSTNRLPKTH